MNEQRPTPDDDAGSEAAATSDPREAANPTTTPIPARGVGWTAARRPMPAPPVRPRPRDESAAFAAANDDNAPIAAMPGGPTPAVQPDSKAIADDAATSDSPGDDGPAPEVIAATAGPGRSTVVLVGALVLVLSAAAVALGLQVRQNSATEAAREEALAQGSDAISKVLSYDYRRIDEDLAAGLAVTTGTFSEEYTKSTETVVKPVATEKKAVVKAEVVDAAVTRATPDEVDLLVYLTQTTTRAGENVPLVEPARVPVTMTEKDGRWLISDVGILF